MNFDFIEIGTSDFDTLIELENLKIGLSIEPIKYYLDKLPISNTVIKANFAVSDVDKNIYIYWIHPDDIVLYNLPNWLRGCNSVDEPHPTLMNILLEKGLDNLCQKIECKCISWNTMIDMYNIQKISHLKIDTEGHDNIILNAMITSKYQIFPDTITFEANGLSKNPPLNYILECLSKIGYSIITRTPDNINLKLE